MIYFNNTASSYPKPQRVNEAVIKFLEYPILHSGRSGLEEKDNVFYACREKLSRLFNVDNPMRFVFTSGSTEGLNLAIKGFDLRGCHVVSTEIEHNSVIRPLKTLESEGVIDVSFAKCDKYGYVEPRDIEAAIRPNTKLIVVNHCSNVTGTLLDLKSISKIAQSHRCWFIVDASQSAGMIPIDIKDLDIDILVFTGHKSLYGLSGIGGIYIKKDLPLKPLKVGGTGVKSEILLQPTEMPLYYEAGTPNGVGAVSLNAGIEFILEVGIEVIKERKSQHIKKMIDALIPIREITIYNHPEHSSYSNFCFNIQNLVPEEVNYILESSYDIQVRSGLHCAPLLLKSLGVHPWGTVRASPSYFTSDDEVDKFIFAIKEIVGTFARRKHVL